MVWPIRLAPVGNVSMGAGLWRLNDQLMVTVVSKATFSFADSDELRMVAPQPVRVDDEHHAGHPMRSLVGASDLAPLLQRVDVTLVGTAFPPAETNRHAVRLAIASQTGALLDKTLLVVGDRQGDETPKPFTKMPLSWGRSFGGIGHVDNPIGTGLGGDAPKLPNVLPFDGSLRTVGFAPIPASFPSRRRMLDAQERKRVSATIKDVPPEVDWNYFQSAPHDQLLDALQGSEWLALDGFSAERPQMRMRLPGGVAISRIYGFEHAETPNFVPLTLDMLHIETDERQLSLTWRGSFPVMSDESLDEIVVAATYLAAPQAYEWPAENELQVLPHASAFGRAAPSRPRGNLEGTTTIEANDVGKQAKPLPFAGRVSQLPSAVTTTDLNDHPLGTTVAIDGTASATGTLPPNVAALGDESLSGTMAIEPSDPHDTGLPFAEGSAASPGSSSRIEIPGAPWAGGAPVAPPSPAQVTTTLDLEDDAALAVVAEAREKKKADLKAKAEAMAKRTKEKMEQSQRAAEAEKEAAQQKKEQELRDLELAKAHEEAEARRHEEAEKFRREQAEAQKEQERRAREEAEKKTDAAKQLRSNMYGGFKRKG